MIKKILFSLTFSLLIVSSAFAQTSIESTFNEYQLTLKEGKFDQSLDYIYPSLFELVPRETMLQIVTSMFSNPMMDIKMGKIDIQEITDPKIIEEKYYSIIYFDSEMEMKLNLPDSIDQNFANTQLKTDFDQSFGEDNVSFNEETGYFFVKAASKAVAVSADGKSDWKFLNIMDNQEALMRMVLPAELADEVFKQ